MRTTVREIAAQTSESPSDLIRLVQQVDWRAGVIGLLVLLLYAPLYPGLMEEWLDDPDNSHALLIPLVSLYVLWLVKDRLKGVQPAPSVFGFGLLIVSLVVYVTSYAGDLAFPARLTFVTTLAGLVLFNYGTGGFRVLWFPILFLLFIIPVPGTVIGLVAFPLQLFVSETSARLLDLFGIPVYREGNLLQFAGYFLEVTEGCSGIRSLVSLLALGAVAAFLESGEQWKRIVLVASTVPLALFLNIVRVTGTGIMSHAVGPKVARGFLHDFSGFVVFGAGLLIMIAEIIVLRAIASKRRLRRETCAA